MACILSRAKHDAWQPCSCTLPTFKHQGCIWTSYSASGTPHASIRSALLLESIMPGPIAQEQQSQLGSSSPTQGPLKMCKSCQEVQPSAFPTCNCLQHVCKARVATLMSGIEAAMPEFPESFHACVAVR